MRLELTPTPEQREILQFERLDKRNLMISALAGSAKTTTLEMIAHELPERILCLAFNKAIATEMQERLPSNCEARTLNSLGLSVVHSMLGSWPKLNDKKVYELLTSHLNQLNGREQEQAWDEFADTLKIIKTGQTSGWIPDGFPNARPIMNNQAFFERLNEIPSALQERLIVEVTTASLKRAFAGQIDFNDQILLPASFPCLFDSYPHVLVDETQDLSELNHAFLKKLVRNNRITAVGDEHQAIYAFRGASHESMELLRETFNMESLGLSISFRCPQAVVREAQWRAPHMKWRDGAPKGRVATLDRWSQEDIPDDAAIICRNNAPIFDLAIKLLRYGRYPTIAGNEIGTPMLRIMKKFGPPSLPQAQVLEAIDKWLAGKLKKVQGESDKVEDQAACMRVFAANGPTLGTAMAYAEHVFKSQGPIRLMTAHKSKGLEFDHVFLLDRFLIRTEFSKQEQNLLYVAQTRARESLTYITTEGFTPT